MTTNGEFSQAGGSASELRGRLVHSGQSEVIGLSRKHPDVPVQPSVRSVSRSYYLAVDALHRRRSRRVVVDILRRGDGFLAISAAAAADREVCHAVASFYRKLDVLRFLGLLPVRRRQFADPAVAGHGAAPGFLLPAGPRHANSRERADPGQPGAVLRHLLRRWFSGKGCAKSFWSRSA